MNNKNLLIIALLAALGVTVGDIAINRRSTLKAAQKRVKKRKKQKKVAKRAVQEHVAQEELKSTGRSLTAGSTVSVRDILTEVQKRSTLSHFLVATKGGVVIKGDPVASQIDGSRSVVNAGLGSLFQDDAFLNKKVTLQRDPELAKLLFRQNRLIKKTRKKYSEILLYFEHNGYRFYVVDPYPQKVVRGRGNAAEEILKRWKL